LAEVLVSLAIVALAISGIITGYLNCSIRGEWLACSAAAQSIASQRLEQVRAARWDNRGAVVVDEVISNNFPVLVLPLDLPKAATNVVYGTNRTFITVISTDPPIRQIRSECSWYFPTRRKVYTNALVSYRTPDQ
jgi:hypothetical protein